MKPFKLIQHAALLALIAVVTSCGGGGSNVAAGIGGTGQIASGSITKFGSIFVNGVEYDIDAASCSVDGSDVTGNCQANLALGMVVTVVGTVADTTGSASSVVFDANVSGPVSGLTPSPDGLTKTLSILGVSVTVDTASSVFDDSTPGFSFATLANDNVVKVSGFLDTSGALQATYVAKTADTVNFGTSAVKIKGSAANVTGSGGLGDAFTLNGITVTILPGADLSDLPGGVVSAGTFVAVSGVVTSNTSVGANKIELASPTVGKDGDEVSVEGLVSGFSGDLGNFLVAGRVVDASGASFEPASPQLADGLKVEVEGRISGTTLVADKVEGRGSEIKIDAVVSTRTSSTLTVLLGDGSVTVNVDNQTRIEDSTGGIENPGLSDLNSGDFVQIRGFLSDSGITAAEIHRESADNVILQGPVDSFDSGASVTILGVTFFTDLGTEFDDSSDNTITSADFYAALAPGDLVKIEDNQPGDGTADEVDRED
jgi:hypothetical protein